MQRQLPPQRALHLQFVVPTGNFGDILAGYYAKRMGLPMGRLGVATNENDILARFWRSGAYEKVDSSRATTPAGETAPAAGASDGKQAEDASGVKETLSPAMDTVAVNTLPETDDPSPKPSEKDWPRSSEVLLDEVSYGLWPEQVSDTHSGEGRNRSADPVSKSTVYVTGGVPTLIVPCQSWLSSSSVSESVPTPDPVALAL